MKLISTFSIPSIFLNLHNPTNQNTKDYFPIQLLI